MEEANSYKDAGYNYHLIKVRHEYQIHFDLNMGKIGITELLLIIMVMLLLFLLPFILYLVTLQNTLKEIKPENRKMQPGKVWLMFIPLFSLVWHFIMINRICY